MLAALDIRGRRVMLEAGGKGREMGNVRGWG